MALFYECIKCAQKHDMADIVTSFSRARNDRVLATTTYQHTRQRLRRRRGASNDSIESRAEVLAE